jgi:hypothetical protein
VYDLYVSSDVMNSGVNNVTPMSSRRVASDCYAFLLLWLSWLRIWLQAVSLYQILPADDAGLGTACDPVLQFCIVYFNLYSPPPAFINMVSV